MSFLMQPLHLFVVDTLARYKWPSLLQFKGPVNFINGELWPPYGFED
jgi:hypothetical protein